MKYCKACDNSFPLTQFFTAGKTKTGKNRYSSYCRTCNPIYERIRGWKNQDGTIFTLQQRTEMLKQSCATCGSTRALGIDHNHTTMIVRGVLCGKCNVGLGMLQENVAILTNMIQYLKDDNKQSDQQNL